MSRSSRERNTRRNRLSSRFRYRHITDPPVGHHHHRPTRARTLSGSGLAPSRRCASCCNCRRSHGLILRPAGIDETFDAPELTSSENVWCGMDMSAPPPATEANTAPAAPRALTRNVFLAGLMSLFTTISSEMMVPVLPLFLTGVLGTPVSAVGLIEGVAESTTSLLRIFAGWTSDRTAGANRRCSWGTGWATSRSRSSPSRGHGHKCWPAASSTGSARASAVHLETRWSWAASTRWYADAPSRFTARWIRSCDLASWQA